MEANEAGELQEHAEHGAHEPSMRPVAFTMSVLAVLVAVVTVLGHRTHTAAVLYQAKASDQWNFYQAKNARQAIAEVALDIVPAERRDTYAKNIEKYKADKEPILAKAKQLEAEATAFDEQSEHLMHQHHRWAEATTVIQISIALAAIALLTRRRWLEWGTLGVAGVGIAIGVAAYFKI